MQSHSSDELKQELLSQTMTDEELHEVLNELGQIQFGGCSQTSIRDVSEGTGADPLMVGELLVRIRQQNLQLRTSITDQKQQDDESQREQIPDWLLKARQREANAKATPYVDPDWMHLTKKDIRRGQIFAIVVALVAGLALLVCYRAGLLE